jgi:hypothetical protein
MCTCRLILKLLGIISEVDPLVSIKINILLLLGYLLRLICWCCWRRSPTEQILLGYSCFVIRFSLRIVFFTVYVQFDDLVIFFVFLWCVLIIILVLKAVILGLPSVQGVFFLVVVLSTIILWKTLLVLVPTLTALIRDPIYITSSLSVLTRHSIQIVSACIAHECLTE